MACAWMRLTGKGCVGMRLVIMCVACNVLCLTSNEFDYNDLIIADIDCTYLLVRRKILRLYRLTPL